MSFEAIKKQEQEYILHSYGRVDVALSHGKNAEAWDVEGKHYYDFTSGIGVNALGYCDEGWVKERIQAYKAAGVPDRRL